MAATPLRPGRRRRRRRAVARHAWRARRRRRGARAGAVPRRPARGGWCSAVPFAVLTGAGVRRCRSRRGRRRARRDAVVPGDHALRHHPDVPVRRRLLPDRPAARTGCSRSPTSRRCTTASSCAAAPCSARSASPTAAVHVAVLRRVLARPASLVCRRTFARRLATMTAATLHRGHRRPARSSRPSCSPPAGRSG